MYLGFKSAFDEYKAQAKKAADRSRNQALLFERFYSLEDLVQTDPDNKKDDKLLWLETLAGRCGETALLKRQLTHRQQFAAATGAEIIYLATDWRFVSGMGNPHPVENGINWHPVLGVPYLPAAGVKGLVRAFATHWEGWEQGEVQRIFGAGNGQNEDEEDAPSTGAGSIEFFDMLPEEPVTLLVDMMTPHGGHWYAQGGDITDASIDYPKIPAPWHNPIPIPFLVVEKAKFTLMLRARHAGAAADLAKVIELLPQAFAIAGAGSKTGTGYGRFTSDTTRHQQTKAENALALSRAALAAQVKAKGDKNQAELAEKKAQQQAKTQALLALPLPERMAAVLDGWRNKNDKELAVYLTGKKFCQDMAEVGIATNDIMATLWHDTAMQTRVRRWNGKPGNEGRAYAAIASQSKR